MGLKTLPQKIEYPLKNTKETIILYYPLGIKCFERVTTAGKAETPGRVAKTSKTRCCVEQKGWFFSARAVKGSKGHIHVGKGPLTNRWDYMCILYTI